MNTRQTLLALLCVAISWTGAAQEKTIILRKGEALDLLLLNTNKEAKEELDEYFATAVPIASKWGYQPQYSSRLSEPPTQGNYWPSTFILASWKDYDKRIAFTKDIIKEYPQFHERRRQIWPSFNLTYWKIEEEQEIIVSSMKTYIATSYWSDSDEQFNAFQKKWDKEVKRQGGKIVLELTNGLSPFGYHYNPERFTITEWTSIEDYERFHEQNLQLDHTGVKHVNQFILK